MKRWLLHVALAATPGLIVLVLPSFTPKPVLAQGKQESAELAAVLDRASQYVALYEEHQLGNLAASEDYIQGSVSFPPNSRIPLKQQRRIQSDFLILQMGMDRVGIRIVNRVDGVDVHSSETSFEGLLDDTPDGILRRIAALSKESARYNIGPVLRTFNVPTYALRVARKAELPRFELTKRGVGKINGVQVWEIKFKEQRAPTLVHGNGGESLLSEGSLWIEPATGRILKTDFLVENPYSKQEAKGRLTVTYSEYKKLGIVVPTQMSERYETEAGFVEGRADYSNFRQFGVDVKSEIASPKPPAQ